MRDRIAAQYRVKSEGRWIRRSLERTFMVAKNVIIWDDGSTDNTEAEAVAAVAAGGDIVDEQFNTGLRLVTSADGSRVLHFLRSPFVHRSVREKERVNELRDKNMLWFYAKHSVQFDWMLCLDGDEMYSNRLVRSLHNHIAIAESKASRVLVFPFVYLWDSETRQRCDAIYGDNPDGIKKLRFPRAFSISGMSEWDLFRNAFRWEGNQGGFHCGSIPMEYLLPLGQGEHRTFRYLVPEPIVHFGYYDSDLRQRKFEFYNRIDPGNKFEGEYKHVIGQKNVHAPGPLEFAPWSDT